MSIHVQPLDTADEAQVRAAWEVGREAAAERRYQTFLAWQAYRAYTGQQRPDVTEVHVIATLDGELAGAGLVHAPLLDNTDLVYVDVNVRPTHRRRGVGTALLEWMTAWALEQGRTVLTSEAYAPVDGDSPGTLFAARHGFVVDLEDGSKVADLQATKDTWAALAAETAPHHTDYRLVTAWDPLPDELVDGYCTLQNRFYELAPSGDLQREPEVWDHARLRSMEERAARAGRVDVRTFALTADGEVAAMTELLLNTTEAHRAMQGGTIVLPEHRGHRLGLALKVANHQALLARFPDVEWIATANADVNAHMNAINDRLGFRVVERCIELTRPVRPAS